jgi:hypothetical protein
MQHWLGNLMASRRTKPLINAFAITFGDRWLGTKTYCQHRTHRS